LKFDATLARPAVFTRGPTQFLYALGSGYEENGAPEIWDSVIILCQETEDGKLSAKVIVCHPDWEATLTDCPHPVTRNRSENPSIPALEFDHKPVTSDLQPSKSQGAKVIIGERLRALREYKALSQVDMGEATGLFRYYISA